MINLMKPAQARPEFHRRVHPERSRRGFVQIVIIAVIALVIGAGAMYGYQKLTTKPSPSPQPSVTSQSPIPDDLSSGALAKDETVYTEDTRSANWKTYTDTKIGFSIKYPGDFYSAQSDQIIGPGDVIKPSAVLTPTNQFNNQKPLAVTFRITISVEPKSPNLPITTKDLFGQGPVTNYDSSLLSSRQIKEILIGGVRAYRVDDLPIGQAGAAADVLFFNRDKFYEIWIEAFQTSGDPNSNKKLTDQILSTFKFLE